MTPDTLAGAIVEAMREYTEDIVQAIDKETAETADLILDEVRELAPVQTGEYRKGFRRTYRKLQSGAEYVVWNPKHYRRVHLLEHGHAKRGGGRVEGRPHMGPALKKHEEPYLRRVRQIIERGGGS